MRNTGDDRNVLKATCVQVSEGNDTHIMLTQLHLLPPSSHRFTFCAVADIFLSGLSYFDTPRLLRLDETTARQIFG